MARPHSCNVLRSAGPERRLWQFNAQGDFALKAEQTIRGEATLPAHLAQKSWPELWQPRLNIAWLPPENVFFRVIQLPASTFTETLAMVELQLEKLSPIPTGQLVWSVYPLPPAAGAPAPELQTLVVVFAERRVVEEFLGQLEGAGYLADRIELQALDQIAAATVDAQGAWIYPGLTGGPDTALVAWWYAGTLQSLNTVSLPATGDRAESLREQLAQMAWAGELEGWLTALPTWTLVGDAETVALWKPLLQQGLDTDIRLALPPPLAELATRTAKRAATSDGKGNLIPPEFAARYRNQFFDRLWIRGMLAVGALYFVVVAIYLAAVNVQDYRVTRVESQVKGLGPTYTNALQLRERLMVLKTREELKFAALDCWKVTAELLPETLTLDSFAFSDGRKLALRGTAPGDAVSDITEKFYKEIRRATLQGEPMFDLSKGQELSTQLGPGGAVVNWNFALELKRTEGDQ
jgi:hypothetical protein